jgi:hypothetical protein
MANLSPGSLTEFLDFLPSTVTIYPFQPGSSVSGAMSWSNTGTSYPARIQMKNHLVRDRNGREVTARGRVFLGTAVVPGIDDKLELPVQFTPRNPPIIDVAPKYDEHGIHHVVLEIG